MSNSPKVSAAPHEATPLFEFDRPSSDSPLSPSASFVRLKPPSPRVFLLLIVVFVIICISFARRRPVYLQRPSAAEPLTPRPTSGAVGNHTLSVRILSLNVFIRPVLVGVKDYKDARLQALLNNLNDVDIACFQELFWTAGSRKAAFLRHAAEQHGLIYAASIPVPGLAGLQRFPPKIIDGGLVIASRYPIIEADYHTYTKAISRSIDYIVGKGVLYARVSLFADRPQRYVHVFTTHLQASNNLKNVPFDKVRASQLIELVQFVRAKTVDDPQGVVLLAGDFNFDARSGFDDARSSDEYRRAMRTLESYRPNFPMKDLLYLAKGEMHPVTSAGGLNGRTQKNERLDYIFLSSAQRQHDDVPLVAHAVEESVMVDELRLQEAGGGGSLKYDTISDHYALRAEILFSETRNPRA